MAKRKKRSSRQGSFSSVKKARHSKTAGRITLLKYVTLTLYQVLILNDYLTAYVFLLSKVHGYLIYALDHLSL